MERENNFFYLYSTEESYANLNTGLTFSEIIQDMTLANSVVINRGLRVIVKPGAMGMVNDA